MGTPGPTPEITLSDTLETCSERGECGTPLTAREVSDELGCSRRTAHRKLERLAERGDLQTKKVGARSRVWWLPLESGTDIGMQETAEHAQLEAFVGAVEDYAIFALDPDGFVDTWNEGARRIKGYGEDEIVGEHVSTFYTDRDRERGVPERNLQEARETGRVEDEGWRVRDDGSEFWANVVITAVHDDEDTLQGYIKVTRDMTERKRAEDERRLQYSVSTSISTAESIDEGLDAVVETVCDLTDWEYGEAWLAEGGAVERISVAPTESEAPEPRARGSSASVVEPGEGLVGRVYQSGTSEWSRDVTALGSEGRRRAEPADEDGSGTALALPVGADDGVAAVLLFAMTETHDRDDRLVEVLEPVITDLGGFVSRMRAEESLEQERAFLDRVLEASPVGIAVFSDDGDVVHSNPRSAEILGVDDDDLYEYSARDRTVLDEEGDPVPPDERPFVRVFETGEPVYDWVGQVERPDGERRWVSVNIAPITNDEGEVERVVTTGEDITELKERERQLRRERDFSDRILEAVPLSIVVLDRNGEFERLNDRARDHLGFGASDGHSIGDRDVYDEDGTLVPPEERPYWRVFESGEPIHGWEGQIDLPRGRVWISLTAVPLGDEAPPERVLVAANNVTKLKEQARRLERRRENLETELNEVFERVTDAFYALDGEWRFTHVNDRAQELLQHAEEELLGESIWDVFPTTAEGEVREKFHEAMGTQEPVNFELFFDPGEIWVEVNAYPSDTGLSVYFQNVTERKERERQLEQYERIVETIEDGIYALDEESRILTVNRAFASMMGYDPEELAGEHMSIVADREVVERVDRMVAEQEAADEPVTTVEATVTRADGGAFPVEGRVSAFEPPDGGTGRVGIMRDVSDRKRREERLRTLNDTARAFLRAGSTTEVAETVVGAAEEVLDVPGVGVYHHDGNRNDLIPAVTSTEAEVEVEDKAEAEVVWPGLKRIPSDDRSLIGHVFASGDARRYDDVLAEANSRDWADETAMRSGLFVPLGEYGILVCGSPEVGAFDGPTQRLVELLAANAEAAYERVERERELEEYRAIVESVNDGVYTVDQDGTLTRVNASYAEMVGRTREELIGMDSASLVRSDVAERARALEHELVAGERGTATLEAELESNAGESIVAESTFSLLPKGGGSHERIAVVRDVTERKERERELEQYETVVETVPDGVYVVDDDYRFRIVNDAYAELVGRPREELLGEHISTVVDEETVETGRQLREGLVDGNRDAAGDTVEVDIETARGDVITTEVRYGQLPFDEGEFQGTVGVVRDVTERKKRERELGEYERIVETIDDGVYVLDESARFRRVNEAFASMTRFDGPELIGMHASTVFGEKFDELDRKASRQFAGDGENMASFEEELYTADGETIIVDSRFKRFDVEGRRGRVGVVRDITERKERERALERYETVFDTVDDGIYILGPDFHFQEVNEAYVEMTGYDEDELVGSHCSLVVGERTSADAAELVQKVATGKAESSTLEADVMTKDGDRVPGENKFTALPSEDGFRGSVGVVRDLSDRREYERELRRYETLIEESTDVNAIVDADATFEYLTPSTEYVLGYEPEELCGENAFEFIHTDDVEEVRTNLVALVEGTEERPMTEFRFRHADGSWVWLEARGRDLMDDPAIDGVVAYTRDVTDRKEYERELESRARQQSVVSKLGHEALQALDLSDLFEETAELVAGTLGTDYCKVLDLDTDAGELLLRQGVGWNEGIVGNATVDADDNSQAGYTLHVEEPVVVTDLHEETRFSGPELLTSHDVASGISTVIGSHDDPWGILGTHDTERRSFSDEDVDFVRSVANVLAAAIERQQYQDELETVIAELEESNERLEQFAHVASHDLQEPLRMVSSYLQLLQDRYAGELDEDADEFIEFAVDGADRMREMINDLLTYSRVDTQAEPLEPTDCGDVVEHVLDNLQVQIAETDADIDVGELPTVTADENQLEKVFQNLLSNALKYRSEAPPEIEIGAERDADEWVLRVSDNGIGIDADQVDRIFDVFDRLHSHDEYPGTGIGLALCKKIVERHGGRIWVESEPGHGSTFYFTIPAAGADPDDGE